MRNVYSVGQVNSYIRNMFAQDIFLENLCVKGEIGNCTYHSSGHIYFTLKDVSGALSCIMFAGNRRGLKFRLSEGQKVVITGSIEVYERDGKYQLYAKEIVLDGEGDLYARYEALKKELEEMGMFDKAYKKPIPKFIRTLGVVTAPTGAAVRDIINITSRRNPYVQIILYPALVQGDGAPESIVRGIEMLDSLGVDVMIVGRGGGSIEDLWSFNDRRVAQAVFDASVPIISAVGHETDTTIIDYVSDLRAPTPSAAAELAVCEIESVLEEIENYGKVIKKRFESVLGYKKQELDKYVRLLAGKSPSGRIKEYLLRTSGYEDKLSTEMKNLLTGARHKVALYSGKLSGLSPLLKLSQGYSYVCDEAGRNVSSVKSVKEGDKLHIYMTDGAVWTRVEDITENRTFEN